MKKFKFIWLDGKIEFGEGHCVSEAFSSLGYGAGALPALDYYERVDK